MVLRGESWSNQRKKISSATLSTINSTWTGLGLNPCLRSKGPSTNCVSHDIVSVLYCKHWYRKVLSLPETFHKSHANLSAPSLGFSHVRTSYFLLNQTRQSPYPSFSLVYKISIAFSPKALQSLCTKIKSQHFSSVYNRQMSFLISNVALLNWHPISYPYNLKIINVTSSTLFLSYSSYPIPQIEIFHNAASHTNFPLHSVMSSYHNIDPIFSTTCLLIPDILYCTWIRSQIANLIKGITIRIPQTVSWNRRN